MKERLLAVRPLSRNYSGNYHVTFTGSFAEAERMMRVQSFDVLDLPADDENQLFDFLKKCRGRCAVCVHGVDDEKRFVKIRDKVREMGFEFRD